MKKLTIVALSALALVSCSKYKAQDVKLNDANDSINYAIGFMNGSFIFDQQIAPKDSDKVSTAVDEFCEALERGWKGEVKELSEQEQVAKDIANSVKEFEKNGLAGNKAWKINEKIFFQGFVNGIEREGGVMESDFARNYFQEQYYANMGEEKEGKGKVVKSKCTGKTKVITLKTFNDSINYAFGFLNGDQIGMYVLLNATAEEKADFYKSINKGLKSKTEFPNLVTMGENVGKTIKEQSEEGLVGVKGLDTNFELIKQGFINGMYKHGKWTAEEANQYISEAIKNIYKKEGEDFLAVNKTRPEVKVTESGLQYEVISEPNPEGAHPAETDVVKVNYEGTLIDGTVFDSSYQRGEPISFGLNRVIKGWTEGLQLMSVGSKYKLYIPYELAYGEQGAGGMIHPCAALIFTVELLDIEKPDTKKK